MDGGPDGTRGWGAGAGAGSLAIGREAGGDGGLLHHYARLDPVDPATGGPRPLPSDHRGWRRAARARAARARAWKRSAWELKARLEAGRRPGAPRA